jgi:ribosome-binding protein aMBF1 (putative translation factor)
MKSWLQQAREESGLTVEQCAATIHQPVEVYLQIEQRPGTINLNELRALVGVFDTRSQKRVRKALAGMMA